MKQSVSDKDYQDMLVMLEKNWYSQEHIEDTEYDKWFWKLHEAYKGDLCLVDAEKHTKKQLAEWCRDLFYRNLHLINEPAHLKEVIKAKDEKYLKLRKEHEKLIESTRRPCDYHELISPCLPRISSDIHVAKFDIKCFLHEDDLNHAVFHLIDVKDGFRFGVEISSDAWREINHQFNENEKIYDMLFRFIFEQVISKRKRHLDAVEIK